MVGCAEFYTAAAPAREERCKYSRPGAPNKSSRVRLASDKASAVSGDSPASGANNRYPPSCTPSEPGMAKAAPRIACPKALQQQCVDPIHRVVDQLKYQIYLSGTHHPAHPAQQKTRGQCPAATVNELHGAVDCRGLAHPLGPIALAGKAQCGPHELAEQAAPLHPIEASHLHGEQNAGDHR